MPFSSYGRPAASAVAVGDIPTAQVAGAVPVAGHTVGGYATASAATAPTAMSPNAGMSEEAALAAAMAASMQAQAAPVGVGGVHQFVCLFVRCRLM